MWQHSTGRPEAAPPVERGGPGWGARRARGLASWASAPETLTLTPQARDLGTEAETLFLNPWWLRLQGRDVVLSSQEFRREMPSSRAFRMRVQSVGVGASFQDGLAFGWTGQAGTVFQAGDTAYVQRLCSRDNDDGFLDQEKAHGCEHSRVILSPGDEPHLHPPALHVGLPQPQFSI